MEKMGVFKAKNSELKNIKKANEAANYGQPVVAEAEEEFKIKDPKEEQNKFQVYLHQLLQLSYSRSCVFKFNVRFL